MHISEVARLVDGPNGKKWLEVAGQSVFELNAAAATIWEQLAAQHSMVEISRQLASQFTIAEDRAAGDVKRFVESLKEHFLIDEDPLSTDGTIPL